jgi:uracil-DNA glycosylase
MGKKSSEVRLRQATTQALESLQRAGVTSLPRARPGAGKTAAGKLPAGQASPPEIAARKVASKSGSTKPVVSAVPAVASRPASPTLGLTKRDQLDTLRCEVAACVRCAELASTRTQTVFGVGDPDARLCFFGEAPGADEDRLGEPFVGRAGQLLDKIIEACHLRREDVYICNVLRCRPPGNRNPSPDEVANCRQHFERQLAIIQPEFVCCLGTVAAQALLETTESIGKLRKKIFERSGMRIACTYHPAYLLRNPAAKRDVWDDMKMLMAEMGVTL